MKTAVAGLYLLVSTAIVSFSMALVHIDVFFEDTYPPLPDILLDNISEITWAFKFCEVTIIIYTVSFFYLIITHKHGSIIARRFFTLYASALLLRSVTLYITRLPAPSLKLYCPPFSSGPVWEALHIWLGAGLSVIDVQTCGDYMFSGHTVILTLFSYFIREYTPHHLRSLRIVTWVINFLGMYMILAGRQHYSIDVIVGYFIASRSFILYHSKTYLHVFVNLKRWLGRRQSCLHNRDLRPTSWFPLFNYFEENVVEIIPNKFSTHIECIQYYWDILKDFLFK